MDDEASTGTPEGVEETKGDNDASSDPFVNEGAEDAGQAQGTKYTKRDKSNVEDHGTSQPNAGGLGGSGGAEDEGEKDGANEAEKGQGGGTELPQGEAGPEDGRKEVGPLVLRPLDRTPLGSPPGSGTRAAAV